MQQLKTAFFDFISGDKARLILVVIKIIVAFLFFIACLLPYMVSPNLIDGSLSSSDFPGGGLYTFILFISILGFAYFSIIQDDKHAKWVFLGQAILATFIYFYALLFHKVGLSEASNGFGKILEFLLMIVFWFLVFGQKCIAKWILLIVPNKEPHEIDNQTKPDETSQVIKKTYIPKSVETDEVAEKKAEE